MISQTIGAAGLYTYNNNLLPNLPPGALVVASNVNCDNVGSVSTRRGLDYYSTQQFTTTDGPITKLFSYENTLYASFNAGQFAQDNGSGTWTTYGGGFLMNPPTGGFLHQMLAGGNSYFTTSNGVYKISGVNTNIPIPSGAPAALDTTLTVSGMISSGFLDAQSQCAYSIVWGYTDNSNLEIFGAPSYPAFASNTQSAGADNNANVTVVFSIPPFVEQNSTLPWFYQIYRTPNTGSLSVPPGNNYQLVFQGNPSPTDYTNGYISYADTTPDSLLVLGADLYTDDGQPDAGNPYGQPPLCFDIAYFSSMAFYANFTTLQNVYLTLDSEGASAGIQVGDTISFTDSTTSTTYTYTGISGSNNPSLREFEVYDGGSPAVNIQVTAQNLVSVINQDPSNTLFTIQYISGYADLPGQMQVFAQNLSQAFFSIVSSRTTCWSPALPSTGTTYQSASVTAPNGLYISEIGKPESIPPAFTFFVGSPNFPIQRIIPVRTALIVIKPEEGVFLIQGSSPQALTVTQIDTTAFIHGSETLAPLNNSGYFFTTQGVMLANESGCQIMSRNIQGDILSLASYSYPNFGSLAFAVGYQSDNACILFLQETPTDTYSTLQYRYNWITQAWTTWNIPCTAAVINPFTDRLFLATPDGYILEERKSFTSADYADETNTVTITDVNTGNSTLTLSNSSSVGIGDQISQTNSGTIYAAIVVANDVVTNIITVENPSGSNATGFINGSAADVAAINTQVTFMPITGGYSAFIKKFSVWNFEFASTAFEQCSASFSTDFYPTAESVTLVPKTSGNWGNFGWGANPWGVTSPLLQPISTYSTKNTSIGHWVNVTISLQQAFAGFNFNGLVCFFDFLGSRNK